MVILDTSIIIDHLRRFEISESWLRILTRKDGAEKLAISLVTIQELYAGKSVSDTKKEDVLIRTISPFRVEPYSYEVACKAGEIMRQHDMSFADAAIAATAMVNGAQLATLNPKDFAGISNIKLLKFNDN